MPVDEADLHRFVHAALVASGVADDDAEVVTGVIVAASRRGVGHHDIADFPTRLRWLADGIVDPAARPEITTTHGAMVRLDGHNALGELCTWRAMEAAVDRVEAHGIGLAVVADSNHFLAAHPYANHLADAGLIGVVMSRTLPSMGLPGTGRNVVGNNPVGFGVPVEDAPAMVADMSLAYASWGQLEDLAARDVEIPAHWATDAEGEPTTNPHAALGGAGEPIGGHKGVSLSLLVEVLTSVLGGGSIVDERWRDGVLSGLHSQTVVVIDPTGLVGEVRTGARVREMLDRLVDLAPGFRVPGRRSADAIEAARLDGIAVADDVLDQLATWADRLGIDPCQ